MIISLKSFLEVIGIIVGLAISWLLLFLFERKDLHVLGFLPVKKRSRQFLFGFLLAGILCALSQYFEAFLEASQWTINPDATLIALLNAIYWDTKSVLTEELLFRGALLYILIERIGRNKSILISACAFGIYHWFSYGIFGNLLPMVLIFLGTGLMGYAWALAFAKTRSLMLPFGLHLGWNVVNNSIFSKGPLGDLLLIIQGGSEMSDWMSLLNYAVAMVLIPIFLIYILRKFVPEEIKSR